MDPYSYLVEIKAKLIASSAVVTFTIIEERASPDRGYLRARLALSNNDFLEVAEYFVLEEGRCVTRRYRHQWMDESQRRLRKRWDNVEHFPNLPGFPHHIHVGAESQVEPGSPMSIVQLIDVIEHELGQH